MFLKVRLAQAENALNMRSECAQKLGKKSTKIWAHYERTMIALWFESKKQGFDGNALKWAHNNIYALTLRSDCAPSMSAMWAHFFIGAQGEIKVETNELTSLFACWARLFPIWAPS